MEVDGHIMMAESGAEVAPEAGAPEAGAEDASDPPQMQLADGQHPPRQGGDQHVHGSAHEPQLHGVHAQVPPRSRRAAYQHDGHFRGLGRRGMILGFLMRLAISRVEFNKKIYLR
jgi:hypothetical protein